MDKSYEHLLEPIKIGKMVLKNRMVSAPMSCMLAGPDGYVTERIKEMYRTLAQGQFGLVIVEATAIAKGALIGGLQLSIANGTYVPGLADLADVIKGIGPRACLQIVHAGGIGNPDWNQGQQPVSPSGLTFRRPRPGEMGSRELTGDEIEKIIDAYARAAQRVSSAQFDAVEIHMAHGTLPHQFMTPALNKRKDKWGDPTAFPTEVAKRVRQAIGSEFTLLIRMCADDFLEGGARQEQQVKLAALLEACGVDALDISAGRGDNRYDGWFMLPLYKPRASIVYLAEAVKKVVKVPVITVGRLNDPDLCEQILAKGRADLIALGRQAWADPEFPKKVIQGRPEDIRQCLACDNCMRASIFGLSARCAINYSFGKMPWEYDIRPVENPRKVMIVGGGVAGMEAARVAFMRKHNVSLYERDGKLGGAVLNIASAVPRLNTRDLRNAVRWEIHELKKLGVKAQLNKEVTAALVEKEKPDVVILATGALPSMPKIPGINSKKVITLDDYLKKGAEVGNEVVVLGGGYGAEIALSLSKEGKKVTLIEEGKRVGETPYLYPRVMILRQYLDESGIQILTQTRVKKITQEGVVLEAGDKVIKADTVIVALGREANNKLAEELKGKVPELYEIGDCSEPGNIMDAVHAGARLAREI